MKKKLLNIITAMIFIVSMIPAVIIPIATSNQVALAAPTVVTYSTVGSGNFTVPERVSTVTVLVIGGGGGGGGAYGAVIQNRRAGGGGGGGGYVYNTSYSVVAGTNVSYTVGDGGAGGLYNVNDAVGYNGSDSKFGTLTATGGGGGGGSPDSPTDAILRGRDGGSGGGEAVGKAADSSDHGYGSQGYDGGHSWYETTVTNRASGGGGGSGGLGGSASSGVAGAGGVGTANSISGSSVTYATGGDGGLVGSARTGADGTGSEGDGGQGAISSTILSYAGGKGGSGIVIISYTQYPEAPTNVAATDGTYTDKVSITWTKSIGATNYYVYEGSNLIASLGDVAVYNDSAAGAPTITAGTASASDGTYSANVNLSIAGETGNNGASRTYKVVANNVGGNSSDSSTNAGYRGTTTLTYQWLRSAADSDASYSVISGATTDPYNDTGAPADGSGRYFKCNVSMTDATMNTTLADRGYRSVIIAITNTPDTWTLNGITGTGYIDPNITYYSNPLGDLLSPGATVNDSVCYFTVSNASSTVPLDLTVTFGNFSGGDTMTNSNTGSNGATSFGAYAWYSGMTYSSKVIAKTTGSSLLYNEWTGSTLKWGVEVKTRSGAWTSGNTATAEMTITATAD